MSATTPSRPSVANPSPRSCSTVRDADGEIVRIITGPAKKGFHRVAWDLRNPSHQGRRTGQESTGPVGTGRERSHGSSRELHRHPVETGGRRCHQLAGPVPVRSRPGLPGITRRDTAPPKPRSTWPQVAELRRAVTAADEALKNGFGRVDRLEEALAQSTADPGTLDTELEALKQRLYDVDFKLAGNRSIAEFGHPQTPNVSRRLRGRRVQRRPVGLWPHRHPPAGRSRSPRSSSRQILPELKQLIEVDLPELEAKMEDARVPWSPGRPLPTVN